MSLPLKDAIIKTLAYSDVFDFPLTIDEIGKWLIEIRNQKSEIRNVVRNLKPIKKRNKYYFLKGRENIINLRNEREKYSQEKLAIAQKIADFLKIIPAIKLVGLTGALAVENAQKDDDIDLLIVTSHGLLWTTRLLVTFLVEVTGARRHPAEKSVNNKICLNMYMDENNLEIPKQERDLFSAHEVLQMKLIWDRDETYLKFLKANKWVEKYLPNVLKTPRGWQAERSETMTFPMVERVVTCFFNSLEGLLKSFQLWYMRHRRTSEIIKDGIIRFHPHDARVWVIEEYKTRIEKYRPDTK